MLAERFKVEGAVGAGGMSLVYGAIDLHSGERVAVKLMSGDRASMGRFEREIQVLGELEHPAIVRYVSHGEAAPGAPFLAMEWLDGVQAARALAAHAGEAAVAQHAQVLRHRGLRDAELALHRLDDGARGLLAAGQGLEDAAAHRIAEHVEGVHQDAPV